MKSFFFVKLKNSCILQIVSVRNNSYLTENVKLRDRPIFCGVKISFKLLAVWKQLEKYKKCLRKSWTIRMNFEKEDVRSSFFNLLYANNTLI